MTTYERTTYERDGAGGLRRPRQRIARATCRAGQTGRASVKLVALLSIVVLLALGAVGILLPIVPGLLFLAIAAILLVRHFPFTEKWVRRNATMRGYLDHADGFSGLDWIEKIRLGALLCAKILVDSAEYCASLSGRLFDRATDAYTTYRTTGRFR